MRLGRQGEFHPETSPRCPGDPVKGIPLPVAGKQSDDVIIRRCLEAGVDYLIDSVSLIDGRTVEVVAPVGVEVGRNESIDDAVHLVCLEGLVCSLNQVVELRKLSAEVTDVTEFLEPVGVLCHSVFLFKNFLLLAGDKLTSLCIL